MYVFSRATLFDVIYLYSEMASHSKLDSFAFRYGIGEQLEVGTSKEVKATAIARYLLSNPNLPGVISDNLQFEIVEFIINEATTNSFQYDSEDKEFIKFPQLRRLLLKDGFVIDDGKLTRTFETDISFSTNETLIEKLLNKHNLTVAKGHYNQAINAFNRGDWAACNSQLRSYVEELCLRLAEYIGGTTFVESHPARIHPQGSHPGLSDEEDSIFRLHLVQISTLEMLRRYDVGYT